MLLREYVPAVLEPEAAAGECANCSRCG